MSHEIKLTKQPARQPINRANQLQKKNCATSQITWQRNNLPSKHLQAKQPEVKKLDIIIHQMISYVIRMTMIGHQTTIKNHKQG